MEKNTTVYVYGPWKESKRMIADTFDWKKILEKDQRAVKNAFDPEIILFDKIGSIKADGKKIVVHMESGTSEEMVKAELARSAGAYYSCSCSVWGELRQPKVSLWKKSEQASHGIRIGDRIEFGRWPQGENAEVHPIRWKVLDLMKETALLITEDCLLMSGYCDREKVYNNEWYMMWGNSLAREMCCGQFYPSAFAWEEKKMIRPKKMREVTFGPNCTDEVFLLSEGEAALYMKKPEDRQAKPSQMLLAQKKKDGCTVDNCGGYSSWWLLPEETGLGYIYPKAIDAEGRIYGHSRLYSYSFFTIRPCILLDLERYEKKEKPAESKKYVQTGLGASLKEKLDGLIKKKDAPVSKSQEGFAYSLDYIQGYEKAKRTDKPGSRTAWHDRALHKWRNRIQLDEKAIWFLSVFVSEDGIFEKYCLDRELASDSHFEFKDEGGLRRKIYHPGDENRDLAEVLIGYVQRKGGYALESALSPFVTAVFHFD